jgi:hypothetical protein
MGEDEEATLRTLSAYRKILDGLIDSHHDRFVNSAGDSILAEFSSVVEGVNCAVEMQDTLRAKNQNLASGRRMEFRIGINLGDVMVKGEQIYGDGVNVAARLESLAVPGGICISRTVYDSIKNKLVLDFDDLGEQAVNNIAEPVHVWRVILDGATSPRRARSCALAGGPPCLGAILILHGRVFSSPRTLRAGHFSLRPIEDLSQLPGLLVIVIPHRLTIPTSRGCSAGENGRRSGDASWQDDPQSPRFPDMRGYLGRLLSERFTSRDALQPDACCFLYREVLRTASRGFASLYLE